MESHKFNGEKISMSSIPRQDPQMIFKDNEMYFLNTRVYVSSKCKVENK